MHYIFVYFIKASTCMFIIVNNTNMVDIMILPENKFLLFSYPERNFPNTTLRGFLHLMSVIKMQKSEFLSSSNSGENRNFSNASSSRQSKVPPRQRQTPLLLLFLVSSDLVRMIRETLDRDHLDPKLIRTPSSVAPLFNHQ